MPIETSEGPRSTRDGDATLASRAYYRACRGAWRCQIEMTVTDPSGLKSAGMSWADRASELTAS